MCMCTGNKITENIKEISVTEHFSKLLFELESCTEIVQKQKIEEIITMLEGIDKKEIESIFAAKVPDKMGKMIEESKIPLKNLLLILKHLGYRKVLKSFRNEGFGNSSLKIKIEKLIVEEKGKEEKREKLFVDLCECYLLLFNGFISEDYVSICMPRLLKVALNTEENEKTQNDVEIALLALSNIFRINEIQKELYLNKIKEIIKHHQEHHNLSRIAYHSAWKLLIYGLYSEITFEEVIVNELHFIREATKELEELAKHVDWKRKEGGKGSKGENMIIRWLIVIEFCFYYYQSWKVEYIRVISCVVRLYMAARENERKVCEWCIRLLITISDLQGVSIVALFNEGVADVILGEIQQSTLNDEITFDCLKLCQWISKKMKEEEDREMKEKERKAAKMEIYEKMEEEGYEDVIINFHKTFDFYNKMYYCQFPLNVSDYFVNV